MIYRVRNVNRPPALGDEFDDDPVWGGGDASDPPGDIALIDQFHRQSSSHRPVARARLVRCDRDLHVRFNVEDRFVRCVNTGYQAMVSRDSCVELFLQPRPDKGYFNFEFNCGGAMLLYYIEDATRAADRPFARYEPVPPELGRLVTVRSTLPPRIEPEIAAPLTWDLSAAIPVSLLEAFVGTLGPLAGQSWRGNFFKCGDETSHPHWASWSPIGEVLRFHQPERFAPIVFD